MRKVSHELTQEKESYSQLAVPITRYSSKRDSNEDVDLNITLFQNLRNFSCLHPD